MARPFESDEMNEPTLKEKVRAAFDATGPEAQEALLGEMADRIEALEGALEKATAPVAE